MKLCSRSFVSPTSISSFSLKHANRSVKAQSRQNVTVHAVAALEAPGTVPSDASPNDLDTQTAYKQFDELLDEYSVSFKSGDKVGYIPMMIHSTEHTTESTMHHARAPFPSWMPLIFLFHCFSIYRSWAQFLEWIIKAHIST